MTTTITPENSLSGMQNMEKWLTLGSLIICCILLAVFVLDLLAGFPFGRSVFLDICAILAAGIVAYLSWDVYREIT